MTRARARASESPLPFTRLPSCAHRPLVADVPLAPPSPPFLPPLSPDPSEFPPIPFPVKALKVLLKDVQSLTPKGSGPAGLDGAVSDDGEDDDEWEDDGAEFARAGEADDLDFLSEMMGPGGALAGYGADDASDFDDEDGEDDDLKEDPIFALDLPAHLKGFFQSSYAHDTNSFKHWAEMLNDEEKATLGRVLQAA